MSYLIPSVWLFPCSACIEEFIFSCSRNLHIRWRFALTEDDELLEIRRRKMDELMKMAQEPEVAEPLSKGQVVHLTESNFWSTVNQTKIALIDFFGEWCGPCKALAPIFAKLAADYKGEAFFGKIDIDKNPKIAAQFGVQSVPNVVVFRDGRPVGNLPGLRGYADYSNIIEKLLS